MKLDQLPLFSNTGPSTLAVAAIPQQRPAPIYSAKSTPKLNVCVLGSGSGGNCTVIRGDDAALLIDAGFGPVTVARRLKQAGMELASIKGLLLTHLDQDHFRPHWIATLLGRNIRLFVDRGHLGELLAMKGGRDMDRAGLLIPSDGSPFAPLAGVTVTPVRLPHDVKGTIGYVLDTPGGRMGYATDLGQVPAELIEKFTADGGVDVLAIESNYDPVLQCTSSRPEFLKRRIMGGHGHLSNQQSFDAVRAIMSRCMGGRPQRILLLHRSSQCNTPEKIAQMFGQDDKVWRRTVLTEQHRRSRWFAVQQPPALQASQYSLAY